MWCMKRTSSSTPKARALGAELRRLREERGVGVRELARRLGTDHSKLSRYESGTIVPPSEHVASVLALLGVDETQRDRLIETARGAEGTNWLSSGIDGVGQELMALLEMERTASTITDVATTTMPGLLQTSDYARQVMAGLPRHEIETRVAIRVGRSDVLKRRNGPELNVLLMENVLRAPIGGHETLVDQLHHVQEVAKLPGVTIRVLPADLECWHPAYTSAYIVFEFAKARPVVHLEQISSSVFLHEQRDVDAYMEASETLRKLALTSAESSDVIASIAKEVESAR